MISKDNLKLYGRKILKKNKSHKWVIAVHGYRTSGEAMDRYALRYYNRGYNVIIPDLRSHRNSEGKFIGMGWLDKDDIKLFEKTQRNKDAKFYVKLGIESEKRAIETYEKALKEKDVSSDVELEMILKNNYYDEVEHLEKLNFILSSIDAMEKFPG